MYFFRFSVSCIVVESYCNFVVWTMQDIHIERIQPKEDFGLANVFHVEKIFVTSVLPELFAKFIPAHHQL